MSMHKLQFEQKLPIGLEAAWDFFSNPANLSKITPQSMDFKILSGHSERMYPGQVITYTVRPLAGIKTSWVTEITQVSRPHFFIDSQLSGPYKVWHHQHHFEATAGGVLMTDVLHYEVPLGWLGDLINLLLIRKKVKRIFEHRREVLTRRFGQLTT